MIVNEYSYKIFASILNDFGHERMRFTYAEFALAVKSIGFGAGPHGILIPPSRVGHQIFRIDQPDGVKMNKLVLPAVQEKYG
ncbi:hypothetical protein LXA43DRAFT_1094931 [Ganoderma leucocontextum]|nr:hypothetical protein LXA43DRAFT_1094931 [Ganoderma leucocontextum]